jgi:hypothetical protein
LAQVYGIVLKQRPTLGREDPQTPDKTFFIFLSFVFDKKCCWWGFRVFGLFWGHGTVDAETA